LHIHLPKPLHGWREFVGEVGVVVIGILIALGGEQMVETLHHRSQVHDATAKLHAESVENRSALDLDVVGLRQSQASVETDLTVLGDCAASGRNEGLVPVVRPVILIPTGHAWSGVRDSALLPLLPDELSDSYYKLDIIKDIFQSGMGDINASRAEAAARVEAIRSGLLDQGSCRDAVVRLLRLKIAQEFFLEQAIALRAFNEQALHGERVDAVIRPSGLDLPSNAPRQD
jgi:hypothetical protein